MLQITMIFDDLLLITFKYRKELYHSSRFQFIRLDTNYESQSGILELEIKSRFEIIFQKVH
jgi:hypothetical protein